MRIGGVTEEVMGFFRISTYTITQGGGRINAAGETQSAGTTHTLSWSLFQALQALLQFANSSFPFTTVTTEKLNVGL